MPYIGQQHRGKIIPMFISGVLVAMYETAARVRFVFTLGPEV
jgi:hypothetical protein